MRATINSWDALGDQDQTVEVVVVDLGGFYWIKQIADTRQLAVNGIVIGEIGEGQLGAQSGIGNCSKALSSA